MRLGCWPTRFFRIGPSCELILTNRFCRSAHERPFSHVSSCDAAMLILAGERGPPQPADQEIFGLSVDIWNMINRCWDRVPSDRPPIANLFALFEVSWPGWVSPAPEAVAKLKLGYPTDQTERKSASVIVRRWVGFLLLNILSCGLPREGTITPVLPYKRFPSFPM